FFKYANGDGMDWTALWSGAFPYDTRAAYWWFTPAEWTSLINTYLDLLNVITSAHDATYWKSVVDNYGDFFPTCDAHFAWDEATGAPCPQTAYLLTLFKVWGADSAKLTTFLNWAKSIDWTTRYPAGHNFDADITAATEGDIDNGATGNLAAPGNGKVVTF